MSEPTDDTPQDRTTKTDDSPIVYYYDASKNTDGGHLPGVPLDDLTQARFDAYPPWLQASIASLECFRKTKPKTRPAESTKE